MNGWFIEEWRFDSEQGREIFIFSKSISTRNTLCFKSYKTLYDRDTEVLLNVFFYRVFVGNGYLVPSYLPHLRKLCFLGCINVCVKYVEELVAALPELKVLR